MTDDAEARLARFRTALGAAVTESRERAGLATRQVAAANAARIEAERDFTEKSERLAERLREIADRRRSSPQPPQPTWSGPEEIDGLRAPDHEPVREPTVGHQDTARQDVARPEPVRRAPARRDDDDDLTGASWLH